MRAKSQMRVLTLFNVDFCAWPLAIIEALALQAPKLSVTGVVVIDPSVTRLVAERSPVPLRALHCVSSLELKWLEHADACRTLARYESLLGRQAISEIAVSDRELSEGWVSGAQTPETPLRRQTRDPDKWCAYLASLMGFVHDLFEQGRFDFVLSFPTQDAPSVAVGLFARHFGVPFLNPKAIGFGARTCLFDDVKGMMPCFRDLYTSSRGSGTVAAFEAEARETLRRFRSQPVPPDYMTVANAGTFSLPDLKTMAALAYRTLTSKRFETLRYPYPWARFTWELRRWAIAARDRRCAQFSRLSDLGGNPFLYFPLHYEPEASTMVAAPFITNQLALVESLAKAVPAGWRVAVKEHLPMLGRRPSGFYRRLADMPKVMPISPFESSFRCIEAAQVTAVITGTAGLEAMLLGRPAVFFGPSPIHVVGEGYVRCDNLSELGEAIELALQSPPASETALVQFLAALFANSVEMKAASVWGGTAAITPEEVAAQAEVSSRLAELILQALEVDHTSPHPSVEEPLRKLRAGRATEVPPP